MKKGRTLTKQPLFSSSLSSSSPQPVDEYDDIRPRTTHPTTTDIKDLSLYREFLPPQDYNGGGKYWKDRCMFMQSIVRNTRRQVHDLEEDQRQLRMKVHELEEQLLLFHHNRQGGLSNGRDSSSFSSSSSSRHFVDSGSNHNHYDGDDHDDDADNSCRGHYGSNNHNEDFLNDSEKKDPVEAGNGQSTCPNTKNGSTIQLEYLNEPPVPERCPSQLRMDGGHTKRVSIDDVAVADGGRGDRRGRSSSSSSLPSVVVTCAQQHRVVSSCLYMTDGEGLSSDEDNNDYGDDCDSIFDDESSSVM